MYHQIRISPNKSLSDSVLPVVFGLIALPTVLLTLICLLMGLWYPLPFAVAELAALAWGFRFVQKRSKYLELITITDDSIIVERGRGKPEERIELSRHWSRVEIEPAEDRLKPNKLVLFTGMKRCEVASCLTDSERVGLGERLSSLIGPACHTPSI